MRLASLRSNSQLNDFARDSSSTLLLPFSECNKPRFDILFHAAVTVIVRAGFSAS